MEMEDRVQTGEWMESESQEAEEGWDWGSWVLMRV